MSIKSNQFIFFVVKVSAHAISLASIALGLPFYPFVSQTSVVLALGDHPDWTLDVLSDTRTWDLISLHSRLLLYNVKVAAIID